MELEADPPHHHLNHHHHHDHDHCLPEFEPDLRELWRTERLARLHLENRDLVLQRSILLVCLKRLQELAELWFDLGGSV